MYIGRGTCYYIATKFGLCSGAVMSQHLSLPKDKIRFLLLEGVHQNAIDVLNAAGYTNID